MQHLNPETTPPITPDDLTRFLDHLEHALTHRITHDPNTPPTLAIMLRNDDILMREFPELYETPEPLIFANEPNLRIIASSRHATRYITNLPYDEAHDRTQEEIEAHTEETQRVLILIAVTTNDRRMRTLPIEQVAPGTWTLGPAVAPDTRHFDPWIHIGHPTPPPTINA